MEHILFSIGLPSRIFMDRTSMKNPPLFVGFCVVLSPTLLFQHVTGQSTRRCRYCDSPVPEDPVGPRRVCPPPRSPLVRAS